MIKKLKVRSGFTLIELLLVIAVIVALAVTVFVALNPGKRLADARDARRTADVDTILTAIQQYIVDNKGALPTGISTGTEKMLGVAVSGCTNTSSTCNSTSTCLDLSTLLAPYLKSIPTDPKVGSASTTYYSVAADANSLITVKACGAENLSSIVTSR
jgi:prepilin-type N-terminal cleavage/methylation domain-containing protein